MQTHLVQVTLSSQNQRMGRWIRLAEENEVDEGQDQDAGEQDDAQSVHDEIHGGIQTLEYVDAGEKESCIPLM